MPLAGEGCLQLANRLGGPPDQALRISLGLQHRLQIGLQRRVLVGALLPSATSLAYALPWLIARPCLASYLADPAYAHPPGLCRYVQAPLSLVEPSLHQLVLVLLCQLFHPSILSHPLGYFI